jgi:hypothetical protein
MTCVNFFENKVQISVIQKSITIFFVKAFVMKSSNLCLFLFHLSNTNPYKFQKAILKISCIWELQMVETIHMFSLQKFITT